MLPTSMAIHSNGYVAAVNPSYDNMLILALPATASTDANAPWASGPLEPGTAAGRLLVPSLVAIRPDQTILVLEAGNQRIQAFSRGGHPVPAFDKSYWIPLVSHAQPNVNVVYLSMCVDVASYVYVLSQNGDGYDAAHSTSMSTLLRASTCSISRDSWRADGGGLVAQRLHAQFPTIHRAPPRALAHEWIPSTPPGRQNILAGARRRLEIEQDMQTNTISFLSTWNLPVGTGDWDTFIPFVQMQTGEGFYPVV
jgi:hypothetical protein